MGNYEHNIQSKNYVKSSKLAIMEKYTTNPAKVHLNSDMEAVRNSITKNKTDTELSKDYMRFKEFKAQPQVQFYILKKYRPTKTNLSL